MNHLLIIYMRASVMILYQKERKGKFSLLVLLAHEDGLTCKACGLRPLISSRVPGHYRVSNNLWSVPTLLGKCYPYWRIRYYVSHTILPWWGFEPPTRYCLASSLTTQPWNVIIDVKIIIFSIFTKFRAKPGIVIFYKTTE